MSGRLGCYWYLGDTQSGKTTKAALDLEEDVRETGWPALVLDCMPARNFKARPHAEDVDGVLEALYGRRTHVYWTPRSVLLPSGRRLDRADQVDQVLRAIMSCGRVIVLWDECSLYMDAHTASDDVRAFALGWAHHGPLGQDGIILRLVSQRPGHIHGDCYACDPEVYVFRVSKMSDRERLQEEFNIDPEKLRVLPRGQYESKARGFQKAPAA